MLLKVDFNDEETLQQLDRAIDSYAAGNHFSPKLFCSQITMFELSKHKCRFPKLNDNKEYQEITTYYICDIVVDNNYSFGEIDLR